MSNPTPERAKIGSLEGLRGLMAWWVVMGHLSLALGLHLPLIDDNVLAVDVFILLSGFVIFLLLDRKRESYPTYIARRAFRIFPLYLLVLIVSTLLLGVQFDAWRRIPFTSSINDARAHLAEIAIQALPAHLAAHIPLLQGLLPPSWLEAAPWTIVGQAWSVSLEWQFYLVAPFFFWCMGEAARPIRILLALMAMAALWFASRNMTPAFLGGRIWHFGLGMTSYLWLAKPERRREMLSLGMVCAVLMIANGGARQCIPLAIWFSVLGSAVAPAGTRRNIIAKFLGRRQFIRLGEMSYSVYLTHMIPLVLGIWMLNRWPVGPLAYRILLTGFVVVSTLLISRIGFRYVERPCIDLGARVTSARKFVIS